MNVLRHRLARNGFLADLLYGPGRQRVVGLAYHGCVERPLAGLDNYGHKHIDAATFRRHLELIADSCSVVKLSEVVSALREHRPLPVHSLFLSFDDGYAGNYDVAVPILKEFGMSATFFISTQFIESGGPLTLDALDAATKYSTQNSVEFRADSETRTLPLNSDAERLSAAAAMRSVYKRLPFELQKDFVREWIENLGFSSAEKVPLLGEHVRACSWQNLREMVEGGMEIGSHTHRHIILGQVSEETAREELRISKAVIERELGIPCTLFCYPNGSYPADGNEATDRYVEEAGYRGSTYMFGGATLASTSPYAIKRHCIGSNTSETRLRQILSITH